MSSKRSGDAMPYASRASQRSQKTWLISCSKERRGSKVIVIHPGSQFVKIGRASDVTPLQVPHVIARRHTPPVPPPVYTNSVGRLDKGKEKVSGQISPEGDEYSVQVTSDDPMEAKIASIATSLRDRMRFYKLKVKGNAAQVATSFNEQFQPESVEDDRKHRRNWILKKPDEDVLVGKRALLLSDPLKLGYLVKKPIYGSGFNTRDYTSHQAVLNDLETIWRSILQEQLQINLKNLKDYSVMLVIPDLWDRFYVHELVNLLMVNMGFKQVCVQQESLAATYGAGITNACVVDIGAVKTSVACVDDGLVLSETRLTLSVGGDDITEFLYVLLDRIGFPYKEFDLARSYDWAVMEDIKAEICTLSEADVELNLYEFVVRRPGRPTLKYGLRAYDEIILAPMIVFEPRVVEFDRKRQAFPPSSDPCVSDEIVEYLQDRLTGAMLISTQHLMPQAPPQDPPALANSVQDGTNTNAEPSPAPRETADAPSGADKLKDGDDVENGDKRSEEIQSEMEIDIESDGKDKKADMQATEESKTQQGDKKPTIPDSNDVSQPGVTGQIASETVGSGRATNYLGDLPIDVLFEASKLPLDVAIFNSARAAGGHEKIRKYLQAVLVVGGSAAIPGMPHALESRLQAIATPLVPNMEKVQIIAPPRDAPPHTLAWKGAAVLARMEGASDLWLSTEDWRLFGLRGLKERCFYL